MPLWRLLLAGCLAVVAAHANSTSPRIAVCFFGLTRSLHATAPMIVQRIVAPLRSVANVVTFLHTYNVSHISNARSKENNAPNNASELVLIAPDVYRVDDQSKFLANLRPGFCRQKGDAWRDQFQSHRNFMCQLNSLMQVTNLVAAHGSFDVIVYMRPDMLYFTAIDTQQVLRSRDGEIYVPPFANWGGTNDRFAFGRQNVMLLYGSRFVEIAEYCQTKPAHAEQFLKWFLDKHNITIRRTPLLFGRVRAPEQLWELPAWTMIRSSNRSLAGALESFV